MNNPEQSKPEIIQSERLTMQLNDKYNKIREKAEMIDDMYWDIEKEGINGYIIKGIEELVVSLQEDLAAAFKIEEDHIYCELKNVMPDSSSVEAFKNENSNILMMFDAMRALLKDKELARKEKDLLQSEMIAAADLIKRDVQKKENMFLTELKIVLPEEKLRSIAGETV
jgi:hypothetical protein